MFADHLPFSGWKLLNGYAKGLSPQNLPMISNIRTIRRALALAICPTTPRRRHPTDSYALLRRVASFSTKQPNARATNSTPPPVQTARRRSHRPRVPPRTTMCTTRSRELIHHPRPLQHLCLSTPSPPRRRIRRMRANGAVARSDARPQRLPEQSPRPPFDLSRLQQPASIAKWTRLPPCFPWRISRMQRAGRGLGCARGGVHLLLPCGGSASRASKSS